MVVLASLRVSDDETDLSGKTSKGGVNRAGSSNDVTGLWSEGGYRLGTHIENATTILTQIRDILRLMATSKATEVPHVFIGRMEKLVLLHGVIPARADNVWVTSTVHLMSYF